MASRRRHLGRALGLGLALLAWPACEALRPGARLPELGPTGRSRDLLCRIGAARGAVTAPDSLPGITASHGSCACGGEETASCHTVDVAGGDRRRSALLPPDRDLEISLPRGGARWLRFSAAALAQGAGDGSLELELRVRAGSAEPVVWRERLPAGGPWLEASLDLSDLPGRELQLSLRVSGDGDPGDSAPWLALAMPRLVEPESRLSWLPWRPRGANALVYLIDTLRPDHMSLYGYARDTTPRMAELFAEGFVFERAYSTAAWTRPATASLFTSLYPRYHGANPDRSLPDEANTLAERFHAAGFTTLAFVANGNVYGEGLGFEQGFDRFLALQPAKGQPYVRAGEIHEAVLEQLSRLEGEPFFAYVHSVDPHAPYGPPEAWRGHFADTAYDGIRPSRARRKYLKGTSVAERDVAHIRDLYDEDIRYQDAMFGELMDELRARGLADGLVTVMTSDHGEELYDHGDWEHGKRVYEEQVRIPLAIHVSPPPRGLAGRRIAAPVQILDVMPTLISWFSLSGLESCQGQVLSAAMAAPPAPAADAPDRAIYCEELRERFDLLCYVDGPWKLAFKKHHPEWEKWGGPEQVTLFNLDADPGETTDLASEEPARVERMLAAMFGVPARYAERFQEPGERAAPELDAATRAHLEALGYVD